MSDIRFDSGLQSFDVNGAVTVEFSPTDSDFAQKIYAIFEQLDEKQKAYSEQLKSVAETKEIFEVSNKFDQEIRGLIDALFAKPVCDALFKTNVMALADGLPVWCNFLLAVIEKMEVGFEEEKMKTNPRIAKYTKRWKK